MEHILYDLMLDSLGTPYVWGGNHPLEGMDCSGLVLWLMRSVGWWDSTDTSAQGLFNKLHKKNPEYDLDEASYPIGTLVFFGSRSSDVSHVGMIMADRLMIEAGGGGRRNTTRQEAIYTGAQTRIRPIDNRSDLLAIINPLQS